MRKEEVMIKAYFMVSIALFSIGFIGVMARKNIFIVYMSIELMLNSVSLIFVALSKYYQNIDASVIVMIIIAIAAAEAAVFLSLVVILFKKYKNLDTDIFKFLRQRD